MHSTRRLRPALAALAALAALPSASPGHADARPGPWKAFTSRFFDEPIVRRPRVFNPAEAEQQVLPFMADHAALFEGKEVLEIGSGSGIVSAFAAKLGARRVVATDIDPAAVESTLENARRLGFGDVVQARLVSGADTSAFSAMADDERFDVVISNPPYALDLDAKRNTPMTDTGDLGFSIVRGFSQHMKPGGVQLLYYASLFYHEVMVKFAQQQGLVVTSNTAQYLTPWEAATLFNSYLERFLEHQGMDKRALRFRVNEPALERIRVEAAYEPLLPGFPDKGYPGWLTVRMPEAP